MPLSVAIIGSGPAGFYTADALIKADASTQVDIIERLPTPYGLIRGGVAPDHQTTKKVAQKYEKTALVESVGFYGNVEVNRDVSLDELRGMYDAVVLAIGAPGDSKLTIPGADKAGVHGSAAFVGWYNGHPDFRDLEPDLDVDTAVIIGNGNVALDIARVLMRTRDGMKGADTASYAAEQVYAAPIRETVIAGRRGPAEAKFTNVELREFDDLKNSVVLADPAQLSEVDFGGLEGRDLRLAERNVETLREYAANDPASKDRKVRFEFFAQPREILGGDRVEGMRFERTRLEAGRAVGTGEIFDVACGLVIAAIGYRGSRFGGAPFDEKRGIIPNEDGRVDDGLYAVGWIKRGPTGVISSNRPDGVIVAEHIMNDNGAGSGKPGRRALEALLSERGVRVVTFEDWKRIDAAEQKAASTLTAPRRKLVYVEDMLAVLDGQDTSDYGSL